jgi:hypothetical protein
MTLSRTVICESGTKLELPPPAIVDTAVGNRLVVHIISTDPPFLPVPSRIDITLPEIQPRQIGIECQREDTWQESCKASRQYDPVLRIPALRAALGDTLEEALGQTLGEALGAAL